MKFAMFLLTLLSMDYYINWVLSLRFHGNRYSTQGQISLLTEMLVIIIAHLNRQGTLVFL